MDFFYFNEMLNVHNQLVLQVFIVAKDLQRTGVQVKLNYTDLRPEVCKSSMTVEDVPDVLSKSRWCHTSYNNVALPLFTGEGYNYVRSLLWRKIIPKHYLVFPMIFTLPYTGIVNTSHIILMFLFWM